MSKLNALSRMSVSYFAGFLILVGAVAGLFSWCLVLVGALVLDFSKPTLLALLLAIPRGSLFALIIGFGLRLWWRARRSVKGDQNQS